MRNPTPFTFVIYSDGVLVPNVYSFYGAAANEDGTVTAGKARTMDEALSFAKMSAEAARRLPALSVMVFRGGRALNIPSSFNLRELFMRRSVS